MQTCHTTAQDTQHLNRYRIDFAKHNDDLVPVVPGLRKWGVGTLRGQ